MSSSSSTGNKQNTCGICSFSAVAGQGQAIFTAECSHLFHFTCFNNYISGGSRLCPQCYATWNNININTNTNYRQRHKRKLEEYDEHLQWKFCDDEPLPLVVMSTTTDSDSVVEKVTIKATPQSLALAAAESASLFSVLVKLKAPSSQSDDARSPLDIVTVLDVSGSMSGKKLDLVKRAVYFVIDNLGVCDRLSIVSFSDEAKRRLPLKRMTDGGRGEAKRAVASLSIEGGTNIAGGLTLGAQVLDDRRYKNPVSSIIFLSDGNDTYNLSLRQDNCGQLLAAVPVHSFGFGSDHDPITMHAIADASRGTFSFIECFEMVQDAFASCIGGLTSVVTHELCLKLRSASHGVEINSIPSGRYTSEVSASQGLISVGDLYADEEKEFLINLSVPAAHEGEGEGEEEEDRKRKTSLLDITCSYKDAVSKQVVEIEVNLVDIKRPKVPSSQDMEVNLEVDRQRNRLLVAESIKQAQEMAEAGNFNGAKELLAKNRDDLMQSDAGKAGDDLVLWLEGEMKETEIELGSAHKYRKTGRAFALAGRSSHAAQRATTRGRIAAGGAAPSCKSGRGGGRGRGGACGRGGGRGGRGGPCFGGYATPRMAKMVSKSQQQTKTELGEGK